MGRMTAEGYKKSIVKEAEGLSCEDLIQDFKFSIESKVGMPIETLLQFVKTTGEKWVCSWTNSFRMAPEFISEFGFYWYKREDVSSQNFRCFHLNKGCSLTALYLYTNKDNIDAMLNVLLKATLFEFVVSSRNRKDLTKWRGERFKACEHLYYHILGKEYADYHHAMTEVIPEGLRPDDAEPPNNISDLIDICASHVVTSLTDWVPAVVKCQQDISDEYIDTIVQRN